MNKTKNNKLLTIFLFMFSLTLGSCANKNPHEGDQKYQIYLKAVSTGGFVGTYEEWLDSIKGEDGKDETHLILVKMVIGG